MTTKNYSEYLLENFRDHGKIGVDGGSQPLFLQVSSTCNARCIFCAEKNNPWKTKVAPLRDVSEAERVVHATDKHFAGDVELVRTYPGTVSEGEPLIHPRLIEIVAIVRRKFPSNRIWLDTNGALLTNSLLQSLSDFGNIHIRLSLPSYKQKLWQKSFQVLTEAHYQTAMNSIGIADRLNGVTLHPTTVVMPAWYGYDELSNFVSWLSENFASWDVYSPGYTKYTDPQVAQLLKYDDAELSYFLNSCALKTGLLIQWDLDPELPLYIPGLREQLKLIAGQPVTLLTSQVAENRVIGYVSSCLTGLCLQAKVKLVTNEFFGGNIGIAELWAISDIDRAVKDLPAQTVILPGGFMDRFGYDLEGNNFIDYEKQSQHEYIFMEGKNN